MGGSANEIVYKSPGGSRVYWDAKTKCVVLESSPRVSGQELRNTLEKTLQLVAEKKSLKILAILVTLEKLEPEDLLWTETDWFPRAMKAGVKYISLAMPKSLTAHMSMDKLAETLDPKQKGYERRFFDSEEAAREWLSKK